MAWGGERLRTKAGIPLGPVGAIFGDVILCCDDDNEGLRLRSFLCIAERVRSDLGIRVNECRAVFYARLQSCTRGLESGDDKVGGIL